MHLRIMGKLGLNQSMKLLKSGISFSSFFNLIISFVRTELARDHLHKLGFSVVGGAITPVHDGYGKKVKVSSDLSNI